MVVTDHGPLQWLQRMKDTTLRLMQWYLALQPYRFKVQYRKGKTHINDEFFSLQTVCNALDQQGSWGVSVCV